MTRNKKKIEDKVFGLIMLIWLKSAAQFRKSFLKAVRWNAKLPLLVFLISYTWLFAIQTEL